MFVDGFVDGGGYEGDYLVVEDIVVVGDEGL